MAFQNLEVVYKKAGETFAWAFSGRTRANGFNLKDSKNILFCVGGDALAQVAQRIDAPSLKIFEGRLAGSLSNLIWWKVPLSMVGGFSEMIFNVPSNQKPNTSVILWF